MGTPPASCSSPICTMGLGLCSFDTPFRLSPPPSSGSHSKK